MLRTLGDIYNYTNDILLEGNLSDISEVIEYFEEFQNIVCDKAKIEAPVYTVELTSNVLTVPDDFLSFDKLRVDGKNVVIEETWGKELTIRKDITSGSASLYYYRKPTALDPTDLDQIPDIDPRNFPKMGQYAGKMYFIVDDDDEMVNKYKEEFFKNMIIYGSSKNAVTKIKNIW